MVDALGIRKTVFGLQVKYVIPRSIANNLRRAIQAVTHISSSEESSLHTSSSTLQPSQSSLIISTDPQSRLSTSQLSISSQLQQTHQSRTEDLQILTVENLREICRSYGAKTSGKKAALIGRILQMEEAVKQGLTVREELNSSIQPSQSIISVTPIRSHHASVTSPIDDDESLLHQLRREEFNRKHTGVDYYHTADGRYNLSIDDQSTFLTGTTQVNTSFFSPTLSRLQGTGVESRINIHESVMNSVDTSSVLGELPVFGLCFL